MKAGRPALCEPNSTRNSGSHACRLLADSVAEVGGDGPLVCSVESLGVMRQCLRLHGGHRGYQLCHPSEVLGDRCECELVLCAARTS